MLDSPGSGTGSGDDLPDYDFTAAEIEPTVLFPAKQTMLEKTTNRKKYSEMIEIALYYLNDRQGSSRQAIVKYIRGNYDVSDNASRFVSLALVKLVEAQRVERKSGAGLTGRFRLEKSVREEIKKGKKPMSKKTKSLKGSKTPKPKTSIKVGVNKKKGKSVVEKAEEKIAEDSDKENLPQLKKKQSKTTNKSKETTKTTGAEKSKKPNASNSSSGVKDGEAKKAKTKANEGNQGGKGKKTKGTGSKIAADKQADKDAAKPKPKAKKGSADEKKDRTATAAAKTGKDKSAGDKDAVEGVGKKSSKASGKTTKEKDKKTKVKTKK